MVLGQELLVVEEPRPVGRAADDRDRVAVAVPRRPVDQAPQVARPRVPRPVQVVGEAAEAFEARREREGGRRDATGRGRGPYGAHDSRLGRDRVNRFRPAGPPGGPGAPATMPVDGAARRLPRRRVRAVGQDRRPGRRRRTPWRGRSGRWPATIDGPVDVFLPRYRGVPEPDADGDPRRATSCACPTRAPGPGVTEVTVIDVAADGYRLRLVDHPPAFDRAGFYGDAAGDYADNAWRFGLYGRAALEALARRRPAGRRPPPPRLAGRPGGRLPRRCAMPTTRSSGGRRSCTTLHNLAYHGWTAERRPRPARAAARATARPARTPTGSTCWPRPSRAPSWSTRSRPGYAARGADAGVRDGPRRRCCARAATGSSGSSTGSTRRSGIPATDADLAAPYAPRRPGRRGRLSGGPADAASGSTRPTTGRSSG